MSWTRFFHRRRWDEERARELEAYLEAETAENIARGMSAEEARYAAHRKLGNTTLIREEIYYYYVKLGCSVSCANYAATICTLAGPGKQQALDLTAGLWQGPPRSFFCSATSPRSGTHAPT